MSSSYSNARKKVCIYGLLTFFVLSIHAALLAQQRNIVKGYVKTETGQPLRGVSVQAKNTQTNFTAGTQTDSAGFFVFENLSEGGPYTFTFGNVGYEPQTLNGYTVHPDANISIIIKLKAVSGSLQDIIVVGYGTQKRTNLTGAVAQVGGEVLENRTLPNISQGLVGTIPNLNITLGDGKPIQSPIFNIRGNTSIGEGGNALVLIDGVQGDASLVNPNDVESITVLKDQASSTIYGARAAFGVVLITTKTPKKGKTSIDYSSNYSLKKPTVVPDVVSNGYQYALMFDSAWSAWNDGQTPQNINKTQPFSADYLAALKQHNDDPSLPKVEVDPTTGNYIYYGNTNWYDLLYKDHVGSTDQNLSIAGNNDKTSYYLSGRYNGQNGLFRYNSDDYHMYNLMGKGSIQVLPWLSITDNFYFDSRYYHNPLNVGESGGIWRNMADNSQASAMLFNPDGTLTQSAAYSVGDFWYGKNGIDMNTQLIRNTSGFVASFLNNKLHIRGDLTFQNTRADQKQIRVQVPYSPAPGVVQYLGTNYNDLQMQQSKTNYLASNIYGDYETYFGKVHYLKVLVGYNYEQSVYDNVSVTRNGLIYSDASDLNLALGQNISTAGGYEKWAILGGFGRINYAFKDRYLLELDARYDGSSKFPPDQKYAFFPSASAGWRISKESFWHIDPSIISDFKIRGSYGSLGNGNISSYQYLELFNISQSGRVLNGVLPQTTSSPNVIPDGLTWETSTTANIGMDISFINNHLNFTGDIYHSKTTNMYTPGPTLPAVFGTTSPKGNYADMTTKGWEANLTWDDAFLISGKQFHYKIGVWMSNYGQTIDKYYNPTKSLTDYYAGEKRGAIWGYVTDGYWTSDNVSQASAFQPLFKSTNGSHWAPGDIKLKDLNGDGVINNGDNTVTDPGDMKIIGNSQQQYPFGINLSADYAGFFFSAFFRGVLKQDWWPGSEADLFWGQYNRPYNYLFKSQLNQIWSPTNPNAYFPRYVGYIAQNGAGILEQAQTKYLQDVKYIKLQSLQIGYNLPKNWISKIHMQSAKIYLSGENLWTASPLYKHTKAIDVESILASDAVVTSSNYGNGNNYPMLRSYTIGLNVTF